MEPLPRGRGFEFHDEIVGGAIPRNFIPAVEKGIREALNHGILTNSLVVDFKVTLFDGSFHTIDSSEMAFKIAASTAFKDAMAQSKPVLLEPIMHLEVTVPDESMGDVIGDLNSRRGKVLGVNPKPPYQVIRAECPMAEVLKYALDLRSTRGGMHERRGHGLLLHRRSPRRSEDTRALVKPVRRRVGGGDPGATVPRQHFSC